MVNLDETDRNPEAFLIQVLDQAPELDTVAGAEQVSRAVLTALANAVSFGQISTLMQALPLGLAPEGTAVAGHAHQMDKAAFLDQVGAATHTTDPATLERQTRAVLTTVAQWAPAAQVADTLEQLPDQIRELFPQPQS